MPDEVLAAGCETREIKSDSVNLLFLSRVEIAKGVFELLVSALAICFVVKLIIQPQTRLIGSWTYLPIALFLMLVPVAAGKL